MVAIVQAAFSGLALGSIYALIALGFSITHHTTKTFNVGQGELVVLGAFVSVSLVPVLSGKPISGALVGKH